VKLLESRGLTTHFSPWEGCSKLSPGCLNCPAERQKVTRFYLDSGWGKGEERHVTDASNWSAPLNWAKQARAAGTRKKVFCASLADIFDHEAPTFARRALENIIASTSDILDWQLCTKRPQRIAHVMKEDNLDPEFFLKNRVWLITSTENQEWFDKRVPHLLKIPAAVHGISAEPLLGVIDARKYLRPNPCPACNGFPSTPVPNEKGGYKPCPVCLDSKNGQGSTNSLDWVIVGGESHTGARPMPPDAARSLRDQCVQFGVPFFFRQHGEYIEVGGSEDHATIDAAKHAPPIDAKNRVVSLDGHVPGSYEDMQPNTKYRWVTQIGTKHSGSALDGLEWKQFPRITIT
jgi:protein gp37